MAAFEDTDFMTLPVLPRRRLAAASLTLLALAGCNALPTGPRQVNISEAQLLERIATLTAPDSEKMLPGLRQVTQLQ